MTNPSTAMKTLIHRLAAILLAASAFPNCAAKAADLIVPSAATAAAATAGAATSKASFADSAIRLPLDMADDAPRAYWDIPFSAKVPADATVLVLRHSTKSIPQHVRALAIHVRSGNGWYAWPDAIPLQAGGVSRLPISSFKAEDSPAPFRDATAIRISAWRDTAFTGKSVKGAFVALEGLSAVATPIAIVKSTASSAPGEEAFAAKMAERCLGVFQRAGYEASFVDDSFKDLSTVKLLVVPYSPKLADSSAAKLRKFAKDGGKLVIYYSPSAPLADLFGIATPKWSQGEAAGGYSAMQPAKDGKADTSARAIPHSTASVFIPRPLKGSAAKVRALWVGGDGRVTKDPACVVSPHGAWFAHVPSLQTPAAGAFLRQVAGEVAPSIKAAPAAVAKVPAISAPANPSREIMGAWFSSPAPCHAGGWSGIFKDLHSSGLCNTAFIHLQAAGTALYPTGGKLPEKLPPKGASKVEDIVAAGKKNGIAVHAWVECWNASAAAPAELKKLRGEGRMMKDPAGKRLDWLCPDHAANRAMLKKAVLDLASRGAHIELDYIRYPGGDGCYCETTRKAFENAIGKKVANWPADVTRSGTLHDRFIAFRAQSLTSWVSELRAELRKKHPAIILSAAVYSNPASGQTVGQDWPAWVRGGLVDFVSPMVYTEDATAFAAYLARCVGALDDPSSTLVPGIGVTADESQLDAAGVARQINACRALNLRGFAFFSHDASLDGILKDLKK